MEAPLRWLAEGYLLFHSWISFRSRPPSSNTRKVPFPIQPPTPAPPGSRLWGTSYIS
ncbi:hypothetical protein GGR56DRAFT_624400 [Xylariaceae sp. FL0804]|nr:hypothetical protein GGR56DRAFT_624400 [Xylariaceae sp. FL0804]